MVNKQYTPDPKIAVLSRLYDVTPSTIHKSSNNKFRIRHKKYRVYTLHQLFENETNLPEYDYIVTFGYEQYYIKKEK